MYWTTTQLNPLTNLGTCKPCPGHLAVCCPQEASPSNSVPSIKAFRLNSSSLVLSHSVSGRHRHTQATSLYRFSLQQQETVTAQFSAPQPSQGSLLVQAPTATSLHSLASCTVLTRPLVICPGKFTLSCSGVLGIKIHSLLASIVQHSFLKYISVDLP